MESEPLFKDSSDLGAKPANPIGAIAQRSPHGLNLVGLRRGLSGWKSEALLGLGLLLVGMFLFFRVDQIPGDFEDTRFNMYVLEHGYRWLAGLDKSFWSAPFFYPAQNVIAYSDNHLGTFLFYSVFRILGVSRETAFQLWAVTLFTLNYLVTWIVLRKQGFHPVGAIAAAYLFTFTLIMAMATQYGHLQLAARFMVPIAFWMATRFLQTGQAKYLHWLLAACAYQIYIGIYIGYFLVLSIGSFCFVLFLLRRQWNAVRAFIKTAELSAIVRRACAYAASCIGFVLVLLLVAIPYYETQREIGHTPWWMVVSFLPRWQSYFHAGTSYVWGTNILQRLVHLGDNLSNEHTMFVGALPFLAVVVFLYLSRKSTITGLENEIGLAMLGSVVLLAALTFYSSGFTFYRYIWAYLPGAGGIRAVSRIMLVLIYPIAFVFGSVVTYALAGLSRRRAGYKRGPHLLMGVSILGLTVVDQVSGVTGMSKRECKRRVAGLEATIVHTRGNNVARNVLWVYENSADDVGSQNREHNNYNFIQKNLDAMLAGQALGLNVVNGYSGYLPKNYPPAVFFMTQDCCIDLGVWARMHPGTISNNSLLVIGPRCDIPEDRW